MKIQTVLGGIIVFFLLTIGGPNRSPLQAESGGFTLVQNGQSSYYIVVGVKASPSEQRAAAELQKFLKEISGAELPIITDDKKIQPHEIILGQNDHLARAKVSIDFAKLGNEGFTIQTVNNNLIIAGGALRGTMYGVYTFLEDYLNCRWFSAKLSRIPKNPTINLPAINNTQTPVLEYREDFYTEAFDGDWAARNKMNSSSANLDAAHGGKIVYYPFAHSAYELVPPQKYFAPHSEYYSEQGGRRVADGGQLCLTNPDVLKIAITQVKQWLKDKPEINIVSITQNDWGGWCECAKCRELDEAEGSHSATIINFVNQIADAIKDEYPDKAVDTFAYQYSRKPPKTIKPRPNVIVRLCSIECCFAHPLDSCPQNASFVADLKGWSNLCQRLYVWDYVTNFAHYLMPFPNFDVLAPNIKLFTRYNVKGVFEEGNHATTGGGEFAELRAYVLAKLLWNPDYDAGKAVNEFMDAAYGKVAPEMRKYFDLIHKKVRSENIHMTIYDPPVAGYLSADLIAEAVQYLDTAETAADNAEVLRRVRLARLPIMYVQLVARPHDKGYDALLEKFTQIAKESNVTQVGEADSRTVEGLLDALKHPRPFLGIQLPPEMPAGLEGVLIGGVPSGLNAAQAGLQAGDVIVEFKSQPVKNVDDLIKGIQGCAVGEKVVLKVKRGGEVKELTVVIGAAPLY